MKIVNVAKERSEIGERIKLRYDKVISLADEIFGKGRITGEGRGIVGTVYNSIYVDRIKESGPLRCGVEIDLLVGLEIKVHNERSYSDAKKFGEELERRFSEEVTLKHNYHANED